MLKVWPQPVHFDPPANSPPAIYDSPGTTFQLNEFVRLVPPPAPDGGMSTPPTSLTLRVTVFDADVAQRDEWRAYVDNDEVPPCTGCGGFIPTSGDVRRPLEFSVPLALGASTASCHRIDLYVSGAFNPTLHTAVDPPDLARATWWVTWQPPTAPALETAMCP